VGGKPPTLRHGIRRFLFPAFGLIHLQAVPERRNRVVRKAIEPLDIATLAPWRETSGENEETSHACNGRRPE